MKSRRKRVENLSQLITAFTGSQVIKGKVKRAHLVVQLPECLADDVRIAEAKISAPVEFYGTYFFRKIVENLHKFRI